VGEDVALYRVSELDDLIRLIVHVVVLCARVRGAGEGEGATGEGSQPRLPRTCASCVLLLVYAVEEDGEIRTLWMVWFSVMILVLLVVLLLGEGRS
jgi:hypothetical protein